MTCKEGYLMQYATVLSASILACNIGMALTWTSPMLPKLYSDDSPIGVKLTGIEGSWVTSLLLIGSVFGNVVIGLIFETFGRRGTMLISSVPIFISWIMVLFARSVIVLYIARFILGFAMSLPIGVIMTYFSEIVEPEIRGKLSVIALFIIEASQIIETLIGLYCSYLTVGIINAAVPVVFFICFYPMPESPHFYIAKGNMKAAEDALQRVRGNRDISEELKEIQVNVEESMKHSGSLKELFTNRTYWKPLFIMFGLKTMHQFSGAVAIQSYMKSIFIEANVGLDSDVSTIICVCVSLPTLIAAGYVIDKFGRLPLYYMSTLGVTFSLLLEAIYFFIQTNHPDADLSVIGWAPITGIFLSYIFRPLGLTNFSIIYLGELFAPNVKGVAASVCLVYGSLLAVIVSFGFAPFSEEYGMGASFLLFSSVCFAGFIFIVLFVPETKEKSLIQIQEELQSTKLLKIGRKYNKIHQINTNVPDKV